MMLTKQGNGKPFPAEPLVAIVQLQKGNIWKKK